MGKQRSFFSTILLLGAALVMGACAGKTTVESDLGISGAPDWVNEGTQYLNDKGGRLFHGVGDAPVIGDASLQKSTADNRARSEVARILSSYMDVASQDYTAASGSNADAVSQQTVSRQIRNLTKINLSGVRIIGRWKNEETGVIYSIAELDMAQMKKTLNMANDMNRDLRRYIDTHAGSIFDKVSREK